MSPAEEQLQEEAEVAEEEMEEIVSKMAMIFALFG